ncbi:uracil-DNA glycosylase [Pelomonas sp. SE-A7]|uniref:uracil-DNA glycosylase n=1 Tax=Pelomonas sp. SE-A7 TaxID=3054953 RepID=UPI00259C72DB|nr:uracil-DNA glycosylase [Pelomonas sp. SE-A7]MDM4766717.1 uracil-DNA glycosylase [Pelomonas sp. SE-A7]
MTWDPRQRAMLEAMGYKVWAAPAVEPVALVEERPAPAPAPRVAAPVPAVQAVATALPQRVAVASARPEIAQLDWQGLQQSVAACRNCGLCESRQQTVFGVGHPQAEWMIVGEAPGEQEDRQGEPFVGVAGQLLDNMLRAVGLTRAEAEPARQVFIANTLKCRPPRNRNPEPEELAACQPYLDRQIELVRPRIILALGRFAVQALLGSNEALGRLRGQVHRYQGIPVIVSYHPAYLLRNLTDKARAWEDLCLAKATLEQQPERR